MTRKHSREIHLPLPPAWRGCGPAAGLLADRERRSGRTLSAQRSVRSAAGMGELRLEEIPTSRREPLLKQLADLYRNDLSSGVHGAAGWLLRQWGQAEVGTSGPNGPSVFSRPRMVHSRHLRDPDSATQAPGKTGREKAWIGTTDVLLHFVVFPAGEYAISSINNEPERNANEPRHPVKLTRSVAVLDREITFGELIAFSPKHTEFMQHFVARPADAGSGLDWYESVGFCRWLGQQAGLSESDQCYANPESLDRERYPREQNPEASWAPRNWPLDLTRRGFRLPMESEWELASRAGIGPRMVSGAT